MGKTIKVCVGKNVPYHNEEAFKAFVDKISDRPLLIEYGFIDRTDLSPKQILKRYEEVCLDRVCGSLSNLRLDDVSKEVVADFTFNGPLESVAEELFEKELAHFCARAFIQHTTDKPKVVLLGFNLVNKKDII